MRSLTSFFILTLCSSFCFGYQSIFNACSGCSDFVGVTSGTMPSGSGFYIQNTLTPTTTSQRFSVQVGSFSVAGWYIMDSNNCLWNTTINTSGTLQTALIQCPVAGFILMENGTFILQEDASKILTQ